MSKNKELTIKQSQALQKQCKDLLSRNFGNSDLIEPTRPEEMIRNLPVEYRNFGIGTIITEVTILSGYKGEIPNINIKDIKELIVTRFQNLSLNELQFAFKIDRYGYHGEPTPHYQIFNAEYVAKVVNKFLAYRDQIRSKPKRIFNGEDFKTVLVNAISDESPKAKEWIESIYEAFQIKSKNLGFLVDKFVLHVNCRGEGDNLHSFQKACEYFYYWLKKEINEGNLNSYLKHPKKQIGAL